MVNCVDDEDDEDDEEEVEEVEKVEEVIVIGVTLRRQPRDVLAYVRPREEPSRLPSRMHRWWYVTYIHASPRNMSGY